MTTLLDTSNQSAIVVSLSTKDNDDDEDELSAVVISGKSAVIVIDKPNSPSLCDRIRKLPFAIIRIVLLGLFLLLLIIACIILETAIRSNQHVGSLLTAHSDAQRDYHMNIVWRVNNLTESSWTAKYNRFATISTFEHFDVPSIVTVTEHNRELALNSLTETTAHINALMQSRKILSPPTNFDVRLRWPLCWTTHQVPNQGGCGSCWAMAATSVMSDRVCIQSNGTWQPQISATDLTSCCTTCGGCQGSQLALSAFVYWQQEGLVTGGPYGSYYGCRPYQIAPDCGAPCAIQYYQQKRTGKCIRDCQPLYSRMYNDDKIFAKSAYWVRAERGSVETVPIVSSTINEIIKNGIYRPYTFYREGKELYGHCAKMIGWGVTDDGTTPYWLYMNTWGREWGENGFFRIVRDEMPEEVVAGVPKID